MIAAKMRKYTYSTLGAVDEYGQPKATEATDSILMAIHNISNTITNNINYKDSTYIGLTKNAVDDTYIINYENIKLKVLYVISDGRYKQVFMSEL